MLVTAVTTSPTNNLVGRARRLNELTYLSDAKKEAIEETLVGSTAGKVSRRQPFDFSFVHVIWFHFYKQKLTLYPPFDPCSVMKQYNPFKDCIRDGSVVYKQV